MKEVGQVKTWLVGCKRGGATAAVVTPSRDRHQRTKKTEGGPKPRLKRGRGNKLDWIASSTDEPASQSMNQPAIQPTNQPTNQSTQPACLPVSPSISLRVCQPTREKDI